jgi:hypothetical protein
VEAASIHLRTRTYLGLLAVVSVIAIAIAFASLAFLGAYSGLHDLVWDELPDVLGIEDPTPGTHSG